MRGWDGGWINWDGLELQIIEEARTEFQYSPGISSYLLPLYGMLSFRSGVRGTGYMHYIHMLLRDIYAIGH